MDIITQEINWLAGESRCLAIRRRVFIQEQGIDEQIEIDGQDPLCWHVISRVGERDVGTARMKPGGHIGRVAVLQDMRGNGVGRALMYALFEIARAQDFSQVHLASQDSAIDFYRNLGFMAQGEPFIEANIPHLNMVFTL